MYFDYALTLRVELQTYWRARPTRAAWLYFANRGLGVLGNIPVIAQFYFVRNHVVSGPRSQCNALWREDDGRGLTRVHVDVRTLRPLRGAALDAHGLWLGARIYRRTTSCFRAPRRLW